MMRILHVAPCYAPSWAYGGPVHALTGLAQEQVRAGHDVHVFTTDGFMNPADTNVWESQGVVVHRFAVVSQRLARGARLFVAPGFHRFISSVVRRADIVHIHEHRTLQAAAAASAARRAGIPYVLSTHGSLPLIAQRALQKKVFDRMAGNRVIDGAAAFVAVSSMEHGQLLTRGIGDSRIRVIPNGLDEDFLQPLPDPGTFRSQHHLEGAELILFLGRLHAQKGLDALIEAFASIARARDRAALVIAGPDDGYGEHLRRTVHNLGPRSRVKLVGPLYGHSKTQAYVDADLVAYPSPYEIFGLVPLEAIACGTPAVVCAGTASADIVDRLGGGVAVPPGDAKSLSEACVSILDDPNMTRRLRLRRQDVMEHYSWTTIAAEMQGVYASCVSRLALRFGMSADAPSQRPRAVM
ncbi:MAG: glycosyltransferase [Chloroflexota bacterium]